MRLNPRLSARVACTITMLCALLLPGCNMVGGASGDNPQIVSISLLGLLTVPVGSATSLTVSATLSNGNPDSNTQDLDSPPTVTYTSSDTKIATVADARTANTLIVAVTGVAAGQATITAEVSVGSKKFSTQVTVTVTGGQAQGPILSISKTHAGNFSQGQQNATYMVTVSNVANGVACGGANCTLTVTENLPAGLTLVSMAGSGWTCTVGAKTCTRSDGVPGGSSFPQITVTVNVAGNATSPQVNKVSLSGGNSVGSDSSDSTTITTASAGNSCSTAPTGNESLLNGQYALLLQGFEGSAIGTPVVIAASFAADGAGKISDLGAGAGGDVDVNSVTGFSHVSVDATSKNAASTYTVGMDSTGSGNLGCLTFSAGGDVMTFHFSVGGVSGGVASKGRVIEFDDASGTGRRGSGILRLQDKTSFALNKLKPNYAFGLDGRDSASDHVAIAGSFTADASGNVSNMFSDINGGGTLTSALAGGSGSIDNNMSVATGRTTATLSPSAGVSVHSALYVVNASEFFVVSTDALSTTPILSGRAVATASSFSASSLSGDFVVHVTGFDLAHSNANVTLGQLNLNASTNAVSGTLYQYERSIGAQTQTVSGGSYSLGATGAQSGRVTFSGLGGNPPIAYIASPPVDGISGFIAGTDGEAAFGFAEAQPNQTFTTSGLAGKYLFGSEDPGDNSALNSVGPMTVVASGDTTGTQDSSGHNGLQTSAFQLTFAITNADGPGTGNLGVSTVAITNGSRLFFVFELGGPGVIMVVELE